MFETTKKYLISLINRIPFESIAIPYQFTSDDEEYLSKFIVTLTDALTLTMLNNSHPLKLLNKSTHIPDEADLPTLLARGNGPVERQFPKHDPFSNSSTGSPQSRGLLEVFRPESSSSSSTIDSPPSSSFISAVGSNIVGKAIIPALQARI